MPPADAGSSRPAPDSRQDQTTSILARIRSGDIKVRDRESLKKESRELDAVFLKRATVSEKLLVSEELGYMRRQLLADRKEINVTYPVNPPFAFVNIHFDRDDRGARVPRPGTRGHQGRLGHDGPH